MKNIPGTHSPEGLQKPERRCLRLSGHTMGSARYHSVGQPAQPGVISGFQPTEVQLMSIPGSHII